MSKKYFAILFSMLCLLDIHAQKLKVESFVVKTNDITARTQPRQDINGNDCALIKVQIAALDAVFSGTVVGNVSYNTSEYLVYMSHGSKRLTVKLEGYLPLEVNFEEYGMKALEGKTTYVLTISGVSGARQLEAPKIKTGWIILESEPSGASVYINNEFVGNTPLNNYKQTYGTYQYRLESPNYHPATGTIELNTGRFEQRIALKPAFGSISVKSNVVGAKILLDGKPTEKSSPATLTEIPSGSHTITLQLDKYAPQQQNVVVEDGQTADVSMSLDARFARITINSLDGADIYSNGKLVGKARISEDMMEGYYDIEAKLDHHKNVTKQIQVVAGQSQEVTLNPIPIYGSLDITSTPHDAEITIDGKSYGKTPLTIEQLLEGEHNVAISKEGYTVFKKVVNITEDNTETISATMEEGIQFSKNDGDSSIKLVGRLTGKDWGKLEQLLKDNKEIRSVDLSQADCENLPNRAFVNDSNLVSIILPNGLTSIGGAAFYGCSGLTSITIPNSVTSIGSEAFRGCSGLTSITIPNSVTSIGSYAFYGCKGLNSITIPNSVTSIGSYAFEDTGWLDSQPMGLVYAGRVAYKYKIKGWMPNNTRIILKDGTIGIADGAFFREPGLTSITIPEGVTNIGSCTFACCYGLSSIYIPESVNFIGEAAFSDCKSLTFINIPESLKSIGKHAFYGCSGLTSITIPNSVTSIGSEAFRGCSGLTSITIPNSVTSIGGAAFYGCKGLNSITIPNSVTSIGSYAFEDTGWFDSQPMGLVYAGRVAYKYKGEMPNGTKIALKEGTLEIAEKAFEYCSGLTSVTIPNSVTSIGLFAFSHCSGLTKVTLNSNAIASKSYSLNSTLGIIFGSQVKEFILGDDVTSIGSYAFYDCSGLTSVTIPNSVTSIGNYAFEDCRGLTSVTIPNSVTNIGQEAFDKCENLTVYIPKGTLNRFKKIIKAKRLIEAN